MDASLPPLGGGGPWPLAKLPLPPARAWMRGRLIAAATALDAPTWAGRVFAIEQPKRLSVPPGGTQDAAREKRFFALPTREQGTAEAGRMPAEGRGCRHKGGTAKGGP